MRRPLEDLQVMLMRFALVFFLVCIAVLSDKGVDVFESIQGMNESTGASLFCLVG